MKEEALEWPSHPGTVSRGGPGPEKGQEGPFYEPLPLHIPPLSCTSAFPRGRGFEREETGIVTWTKLLKNKTKQTWRCSISRPFPGLRRAGELRFPAGPVGGGLSSILPSAQTPPLLRGGPAGPAPSRAPRMPRGGWAGLILAHFTAPRPPLPTSCAPALSRGGGLSSTRGPYRKGDGFRPPRPILVALASC